MKKSLQVLSLSLLLSGSAHAGKINPTIKTTIETNLDPDMTPENSIELTNEILQQAQDDRKDTQEKPIVEPSFWQTWISDSGNGVITNIFNEIENNTFDDRAQGNITRLESAVQKLLTNKQHEKLAQLYFLIKEKGIHFNNELNEKVVETLNTYKEKQDQQLFDDI